jgi:hypothetical protein
MDTKKLFIRIISCLAIICLFNTFVYSQTEEYFKQMDGIFDIPSRKITTGILINRAPGLIDMKIYSLQKNIEKERVCNREDWLLLYYSLYAAHLNPKEFRYDLNLYNEYRTEDVKINDAVPLGLIYYRYDKIRDDAIIKRLIDADTIKQRVSDLTGNGTPLETANCLAFTIFADSIEAGRNEFILPQSLFVSNQQNNINAIYVDFGDGQGFIQVLPDIPVTLPLYFSQKFIFFVYD